MLYNFFRIILYVLMIIISLFSSKRRKFIIKRLFGNYNFLKKNENYIWIHCSSVGEVNLSDSLIKKVLKEREERIFLSVFTDTGYENAIKKYAKEERIDIGLFPLDDYFLINKILNRINLKMLILIETEIWPNLISLASKKSKIILVNGRISDKSYKKYLKLKNILKNILTGKIDRFYMQTALDGERIKTLGATENKVFVVGNLKFDIDIENYSDTEKLKLKKEIKVEGRKIFVAGSTRTGEDEILVEAFKNLKKYILVLVPRHLERVPKIEEILKSNNLSYGKYSEIKELKEEKNVIIVDKMGVLRKFYSICDIAFVGGTLVNIGGHSLLEPLFFRKTPIFGEYLQNVKSIAKEILKREIGFKVSGASEIVLAIKNIETGKVNLSEIDDFFEKNRNVSSKILNGIKELID